MSGQTPRTDANVLRLTINGKPLDNQPDIVLAKIARKLETDLSEAVAALKSALVTNGGPVDHADTVDGKAYVLVEMAAFENMSAIVARLGG